MTDQQRNLLGTLRWGWLREFVEVWYAEPLTAEDGSTAEQLTTAEERVGPLPVALREWFTLVGARLRSTQD